MGRRQGLSETPSPLRGNDQLRYAIFDAIKAELPNCRSWEELAHVLHKQGIEIRFKKKGHTEQVEGVIFVKDGVNFSGSHIDRSCSYAKLIAQLEENRQSLNRQQEQSTPTESFAEGLDEVLDDLTDGLFTPSGPSVDVAELVFQRKLRNQTNKKFRRRRS